MLSQVPKGLLPERPSVIHTSAAISTTLSLRGHDALITVRYRRNSVTQLLRCCFPTYPRWNTSRVQGNGAQSEGAELWHLVALRDCHRDEIHC